MRLPQHPGIDGVGRDGLFINPPRFTGTAPAGFDGGLIQLQRRDGAGVGLQRAGLLVRLLSAVPILHLPVGRSQVDCPPGAFGRRIELPGRIQRAFEVRDGLAGPVLQKVEPSGLTEHLRQARTRLDQAQRFITILPGFVEIPEVGVTQCQIVGGHSD